MNFKQWTLLGFGMGMVALLFALPRTVLKKTESNIETTLHSDDDNHEEHAHSEQSHSGLLQKIETEIKSLKASVKVSPNEVLLQELVTAYNKGFAYDSSAKYAAQLVGKFPTDQNRLILAEVYYEMFLTATNEKDAVKFSDKCRDLFTQVKNPLNDDQKSKLAMTYTTTSTPMKGISMLREVVEKDPKHELATYNLGLLSLKSGQFDKAKERFLTLRKSFPDNLTYSYYLGICYAQLADNKSAIVEFQKIASKATDPVLKSSAEKMLEQLK